MIKTKPWTGGTEEEYETQHFGFGAQRLKIAIRQMVEQKITNGVKDMESYLQESLDLNETDKATLTKSCDKLIRLYCERAGPSLGAIDEEIERMLEIPQKVLLPEDEVQIEQTSDSDFEKLKEEVASLRRRVERGALMEALLSAEEEELASVEKVCETAKKDMDVIDLLYKSADNIDSMRLVQSETLFMHASASFMKKQNNLFD